MKISKIYCYEYILIIRVGLICNSKHKELISLSYHSFYLYYQVYLLDMILCMRWQTGNFRLVNHSEKLGYQTALKIFLQRGVGSIAMAIKCITSMQISNICWKSV